MPEILGPLYEAVLAYCLRMRNCDVAVASPRPHATCRAICPFATECTRYGFDPFINIDPDVAGATSGGIPLVGFVTHWRTTGFEKKFWRTVEEILEYHTHRAGCIGVSFVAEPISQSERLRQVLGVLAGVDIDMPKVWGRTLQKAVDALERAAKDKDVPTEVKAALEFVEATHSGSKALSTYVRTVAAILDSADLVSTCRIPQDDLFRLCIQSRRHSGAWRIRSIQSSARTSGQLLALVLHALDATGHSLSEAEYVRGYVNLRRDTDLGALAVLAATPFRIAGRERYGFVTLTQSIRGPVLRFEPRAFPDVCRTANVLTLARSYLEYLKRNETWVTYLDRLTHAMLGPSRQPATKTLTRNHGRSLLHNVLVKGMDGWILDLLISAADLSQVRLAAAVDIGFKKRTGASLQRIATYGDEAKKVISYCARNRSNMLRNAPGLDREATLSALSLAIWDVLDEAIEWPLDMMKALDSLRVRDIRTFLSGAPHPVLGALSVTVEQCSLAYATDRQVPTIITSWVGGNTGRTEYQFQIEGGKTLFIKVSTGQDGHSADKWKELAARVRSHRALAGEVEAWLLLDGDWTDDAVTKLYEAGYRRIFSVDEISDVEVALREWAARNGR